MKLSTAIYGGEAAKRELLARGERASNLTGAWDRLLPGLRKAERRVFATRGHGTWPANRPGTIRRKGRNTPMFDTGRLYRALTIKSQKGSIARRSRTQMVFGVNDRTIFYSRFVGRQRRFMLSDREAARLGARAVNDWLSHG